MGASNDIPKPLDVTKPSDIKPVALKPLKPTPVNVPKPPPPFVDISVGEAIGLWFKWWWRNKAADAMAGLPADVLPSIAKIDSLVKYGLILLVALAICGGVAWMILR